MSVVTVFASRNAGDLIMAKMLLEAEGIRFVTEGEGVQDLFGLGRSFGGYNPVTGPVQLRVTPEDAARALEVLQELRDEPGT